MSKPKTPKAPNYTNLANQQANLASQQWQKELTAARPNQVGPTGSLTWAKDPTTGAWTQTTALNAPEQQLYEAQRGNQQRLAGMFGNTLGGLDTSQIDFSGAPAMPEVGGYDQRSIDTIRALQSPQLQRQRASKEAQLAAMGMGTGSGQAWNTEQQNIGDVENRADLEAILAGIQQGNTMFGQGLQSREQAITEALRQRAGNLGTLGTLGELQGDVLMPEYTAGGLPSTATGAVPNLIGAAGQQYGAAMDKYNAKNSGGFGGFFGSVLGSAAGPIGGAIGSKIGGMFGK